MKTGYSILLGEFIAAEKLEYKDCEPFQIVCPFCSEPLFKVTRKDKDKLVEYLSHYRKSESYSDCDLRSESSLNKDKSRHNSESREQNIEYFLKVFETLLTRDSCIEYSNGIEKTHRRINKSKAFRELKYVHFDTARKTGFLSNTESFTDAANFYIAETAEFGGIPVTGFSVETQIRISSDIAKLLLTEKGRKNYYSLFNHSTIYLLNRNSTPSPSATPQDIEVMNNIGGFIVRLIDSGKKGGMATLAEMVRTPIYPPYVEEPATYMLKVSSEIAHEMIGTLIRLPYFSLLKDMQASKA